MYILQSAELDGVTAKVLSVYLYKGRKLNKTDKLRLGTQIARDEMCNTARRRGDKVWRLSGMRLLVLERVAG